MCGQRLQHYHGCKEHGQRTHERARVRTNTYLLESMVGRDQVTSRDRFCIDLLGSYFLPLITEWLRACARAFIQAGRQEKVHQFLRKERGECVLTDESVCNSHYIACQIALHRYLPMHCCMNNTHASTLTRGAATNWKYSPIEFKMCDSCDTRAIPLLKDPEWSL